MKWWYHLDISWLKKGEGLHIKVGTYVLETNVHFPTDVNLLWDAGRKSLDMIEDAIEEGILDWKGWRKGKYWRRALKKLMRMSAKASSGGGKNKAEQEEESSRTFKNLRHKHSAIEADINRLEHHGLDSCPDKGLNAFKRYCALGVLAANLHKLGNVLQEKARKQCEKSRKAA